MLETLFSPRKAERREWEMFFVGFFYSALSVILVNWFFGSNDVMGKYSGILIVTFTVMFSTPFVYFLFRREERKDFFYEGIFRIFKEHQKAIRALLWLFIGFLVGYSILYIALPKENFYAQIETYCSINRPNNMDLCVKQYGQGGIKISGFFASIDNFLSIFSNNINVLIFIIFFSLIFGAGGIFILAWNASVIAAAIGINTNSQILLIPLWFARYMTHGTFEIAAYIFGALAGGILSVAITKRDYHRKGFWDIIQDSLNLIIIAVILLLIAGLIEVYITSKLF